MAVTTTNNLSIAVSQNTGRGNGSSGKAPLEVFIGGCFLLSAQVPGKPEQENLMVFIATISDDNKLSNPII